MIDYVVQSLLQRSCRRKKGQNLRRSKLRGGQAPDRQGADVSCCHHRVRGAALAAAAQAPGRVRVEDLEPSGFLSSALLDGGEVAGDGSTR